MCVNCVANVEFLAANAGLAVGAAATGARRLLPASDRHARRMVRRERTAGFLAGLGLDAEEILGPPPAPPSAAGAPGRPRYAGARALLGAMRSQSLPAAQ